MGNFLNRNSHCEMQRLHIAFALTVKDGQRIIHENLLAYSPPYSWGGNGQFPHSRPELISWVSGDGTLENEILGGNYPPDAGMIT